MVFEREKRPERAGDGHSLRGGDRLARSPRGRDRGGGSSAGSPRPAGAGGTEGLSKLLSLAATVANLRGEYQKAAAYQAQLERLAPGEKAAADELPRGGTLVVAMANPVAAADPAVFQTVEEQEFLGKRLRDASHDGPGGEPRAAPRRRVAARGRRPGGEAAAQARRPLLRRRADDGRCREGLPGARRSGVRTGGLPAALGAIRGVSEYRSGSAPDVAGIRAVSEDRVEIELTEPLPIFPALLTDLATAIVRPVAAGTRRRTRSWARGHSGSRSSPRSASSWRGTRTPGRSRGLGWTASSSDLR